MPNAISLSLVQGEHPKFFLQNSAKIANAVKVGAGLSTSRPRSRLGPKIEHLGLDLRKSGKVAYSVSSQTGSQTTSRYRTSTSR